MPGIPDTNPKDDKSIGVIIPPPEIRKIADKTAEYVAKNGSAFEEIVQRSESNNAKFSFLKAGDPFRAYFEQKVIEFAQGIVPEKEEPKPEPVPIAPTITQKKDIKKELKRDIKPPTAEKYTVEPTTSITLLDMDIIKLSAQFVAKNGQKFLLALTEREKQNPQFDFLKPTHQLFSFFTSLVGAYSDCINPSRKEVERIRQFANEKMAILNASGERFEFEQQQTQLKKTKDDREDEERAQMAQIDWNDFVIVETIDLFDDEALPAPSNFANKPEVRTIGPEVEAYRGQASAEPATAFPLQKPTETPIESDIKVKKDYVRKAAPGDSATNKCPICNQYIPVSEFNEHLRIEMLDPNYRNVRADVQARAENITMVSGDEIAQNLRNMTRGLPTVFGSAEQERRDAEARGGAAPKLIWDGQSGTMTRTTANQAMIAQQQKKNYEEQMRVVSEKLEPARPGMMMPTAGPQLQPMVTGQGINRTPAGPHLPQEIARTLAKPAHEKPELSGGEGTKKVRTEEANLLPEDIWLMTNPGSVSVNISVPNIEEEGVQSKRITATFDPKTTIQAVKEQISAQLGGFPAAKMRLRTQQQSVLRDEATLAYYNIWNGAVIDLGLKERGGRNH